MGSNISLLKYHPIYQDMLGIIIRESCAINCNDIPRKLLLATDHMNQRSGTVLTNAQFFTSQSITKTYL